MVCERIIGLWNNLRIYNDWGETMKMKLFFISFVLVFLFSGSKLADGYVKPDQWGGYDCKEYNMNYN